LQELVTDRMTKRIVHGLELIEVEVMNRHHLLAIDQADRVFEPLVPLAAPAGSMANPLAARAAAEAKTSMRL